MVSARDGGGDGLDVSHEGARCSRWDSEGWCSRSVRRCGGGCDLIVVVMLMLACGIGLGKGCGVWFGDGYNVGIGERCCSISCLSSLSPKLESRVE